MCVPAHAERVKGRGMQGSGGRPMVGVGERGPAGRDEVHEVDTEHVKGRGTQGSRGQPGAFAGVWGSASACSNLIELGVPALACALTARAKRRVQATHFCMDP